MNEVVLRFAGRFVFANRGGDVQILAINPMAESGISAKPHHVFFTAPQTGTLNDLQGRMRRAVDSGVPLRPPSYRLMAATHTSRADHGVWNLGNHNVEIDVGAHISRHGAGLSWAPGDGSEVADLRALSGGKSSFNEKLLDTSARGNLIVSVIHLPAGFASPRQVRARKLNYTFEKFGNGEPSPKPLTQLADVVEVILTVDVELRLSIFPRIDGKEGVIIIPLDDLEPTIVNFSNLCVTSHTGPDKEFAALYDVLDHAPSLQERLIPKVASGPDEVPFGDCYPGGLVNF